MNLNGGYAMIKHNATQEELAVAYKTKRPILLYDEDKRAHWAQINEKEVETIDEETEETTITYEYSYELLNAIEALVDDSGNPRFIEGDGVPLFEIPQGVKISYAKWSLSGTHLMIVLAGEIANGTVLASQSIRYKYEMPAYILDKIIPTISSNSIELKDIMLWGASFTNQALTFRAYKESEYVAITCGGLTLTADRTFRVQFDLLIDTE